MARRFVLFILAALALAACKPDRFDVSLATGDIVKALAGSPAEAPFEMAYDDVGSQQDGPPAGLDALERIMRAHMQVDSFDLAETDSGYSLTISGRLPVAAKGSSMAPYYLAVAPATEFDGYTAVELVNGADFETMQGEMSGAASMMTPERYNPVRVLLRGNGESLIVPGAQIDGKARALFRGNVSSHLALGFKGGVWDDTGAYFLIRLK